MQACHFGTRCRNLQTTIENSCGRYERYGSVLDRFESAKPMFPMAFQTQPSPLTVTSNSANVFNSPNCLKMFQVLLMHVDTCWVIHWHQTWFPTAQVSLFCSACFCIEFWNLHYRAAEAGYWLWLQGEGHSQVPGEMEHSQRFHIGWCLWQFAYCSVDLEQ